MKIFFVLLLAFSSIIGCQLSSPHRVDFVPNYAPSHIQVENLNSPTNLVCAVRVSAIDFNGDTIKYEFDWENNGLYIEHTQEWAIPGYPVEVMHAYKRPGKYKMRITAVDAVGARSNAFIYEIKIP
jgi:hypothetical protein